ncbi:MAG: iron-containing alcohol dehydrogenase [Bryobacteraceae bacterium]
MIFEFATATRIVFGPGKVREVPSAARAMGKRSLLVTGAHGQERSAWLQEELDAETWLIPGEPTLDIVRQGVEHARATRCDVIIAFGGGSSIDSGKAIAAMLTNPGDPIDYLEVIGKGKTLEHPSAPFIAIPTTAGTGAEVTRNAVLGSPEHRVKVSLRSPHMLPRLALVDPELTHDLPPAITASTGLDALTQLIEAYVSTKANPMTDALCREGLHRATRSIRRAFEHPHDAEARLDMSLASLFSGLALANAGLGAVHGFAAPIGGMFQAPHGAVCAALLPHATEINIRALRSRSPDNESLRRYEEINQTLNIVDICQALQIPALKTYGITGHDIPSIVAKASQASSMKANPIVLTENELTEIVIRAR